MGRTQYSFIDKKTTPMDLHHSLKDLSNTFKHNSHKLINRKNISRFEPFVDDI